VGREAGELGEDVSQRLGAIGSSVAIRCRDGSIAEHNTARFGGGQAGTGAIRDQLALLLGERRVDVQRKRIDLGAELRHNDMEPSATSGLQ
jgi:hypothetical protein